MSDFSELVGRTLARDRAAQGEVAQWQYRWKHPLPNGDMCDWRDCSASTARVFGVETGAYEVRPLYTAPPAAGVRVDELLAKLHRLAHAINNDTHGDYHLNLSAEMLGLLESARFSRAALTAGEGA